MGGAGTRTKSSCPPEPLYWPPTAQHLIYDGEIRLLDQRELVRRLTDLDRSSETIRDHLDASWGGPMEFRGTCDQR
jgi:hypothetical protein